MKITTFNPDGSIKEVREHHFQIPKYITSFDPNHSFFDITDEDVAVVSYKGVDIEKDLLLNQYRFLIKFDYNNFLKQYSSESKIQDVAEARARREQLSRYDEALSSILRFYRAKQSVLDETRQAQIREFESSNLWIDTILYHAERNQNRIPGKTLRNSLLSVIHRLYHAIRKSTLEGDPLSSGFTIMETLYPFVGIQSSIMAKSDVLEDDDVLAKLMGSLAYSNGKFRSGLYTVMHLLDSSINSSLSSASGLPNRTISMVINEGNSECVTIPANPSNGVEIKKIELVKEEIVCLKCPYVTINKEALDTLGDALRNEYEKFYNINGGDVEKEVEIEVTRHYELDNANILTHKHWKDFYFLSLDMLEDDYKSQYEKVRKLEIPYYYYFLLVARCHSSHRYDFNGYLLESLAYMATQEKFVERSTLYYQMTRLNYMEESANIIKKNVDSKGDNPMEEVRFGLLQSDQANIAKEFLTKSFTQGISKDALLQRVLVFLTPLFHKDYIIDMDVVEFKEILSKILKNDGIMNVLMSRDCYLPFNLKLVLNIIGYLSKDNVDFTSTVKPPLKARLGNNLCDKIECLWGQRLPSNYRKCVPQYANILYKKDTRYTIFNAKIKSAVDYEWKKSDITKRYVKEAEKNAELEIASIRK